MPTIRSSWFALEVGATEPTTLDAIRATRLSVEVGGGEPETTLDSFRVSRLSVEVGGGEPEATLDSFRVTRLSLEVGGTDTTPAPPPPSGSLLVSWQGLEIGGGEPESTLDSIRASRISMEVGGTEHIDAPTRTRLSWLGVEVGGGEPEDTLDSMRVSRLSLEIGGTAPAVPTQPASVDSFVWDKKHDTWWHDTFPEDQAPTCTAAFDADDPDDRVVAIGCSDGYLRIFDQTATRDDEATIYSKLLIGPLSLGLPATEARFDQLQVALARDQNGARFDWYVSEDPDVDVTTLTPVRSGLLPAGLSDTIYGRVRGLYVWLLITGVYSSWAYEAGSVMAAPAGRARTRG